MQPLRLFYNLLQTTTWPLWMAPLLAPKRRPLLKRRLFPPKFDTTSPIIWVHALSVGEAQACRGLLKALRKNYPEATLLLSLTTTSGFQFAQKHLSPLADHIFPSPLDLWPIAKAFGQRLRPDLFLLIETDVWPNLLWELRRLRTQIVLLNGALSEKAFGRLKRLRGLAHLLFDPFHKIFTATQDDAERFVRLLPQKEIRFIGNLKFDVGLPDLEQVKSLFAELGPCLKRPVVVCGSTHPGEERLLLEGFRNFGQGSLILCPRHPERAQEILILAQKQGFKTTLRSQAQPCQVLVVDTLGELRTLYALADVAFVGGTLVPIGGHSLIEPASLGVPVTFGPYVESIRELAVELERNEAGLCLAPDPSDLAQGWQRALAKAPQMGAQAEKIYQRHQGTVERLLSLLDLRG